MSMVVIVLFCVIPMLAWAVTLLVMKSYSLTGERMKTIQAVAGGMTLAEAMETIHDETVGVGRAPSRGEK